MYDYIIIALFSCLGALITFFSGFGLGTILLPVFTIFFSLPEAVMLTAVVHLLNSVFKGALVFKYIRKDIVIKFGVPAIVTAFFGAFLLYTIQSPSIVHHLFGRSVTIIGFVMGLIILFFALFEIVPALSKMSFPPSMIFIGGLITGFFGGLSGHQGALRSAFFLRLRLSKEQLIATGTAVAILIDCTRISVYLKDMVTFNFDVHKYYLIVGVISAFIGSFLGNKYLKKMTIPFVQMIVAICLIVYGVALLTGYVQVK
jgi:uncharacterized protein